MLQVPVPRTLLWQLLALAFADYVLAYNWEQFLRRRFPAACPPQKGYLAYQNEFDALKSRQLKSEGVFPEGKKTL